MPSHLRRRLSLGALRRRFATGSTGPRMLVRTRPGRRWRRWRRWRRSEGLPVETTHEFPGLELAADVSAGRWVAERLYGWERRGPRLGAILPEGFEAYARILHPAFDRDGHPVRWAVVAALTGRTVHDGAQFERLSTPAAGGRGWDGSPPHETLSKDDTAALARALEPFTSTPQACWFALWDGFGDMDVPARGGPPRLEVPWRRYLLYRGPLASATAMDSGITFHCPNLWWPEDRTWCVASEIDLVSTYVGGTEACIAAVLRAPELEAMRTTLDVRFDAGGDALNL